MLLFSLRSLFEWWRACGEERLDGRSESVIRNSLEST